MSRYLIEVIHGEESLACRQAIHSIQACGASFVQRAEWGCRDGDHRGWLIVEVPDRNAALMTVPPALRSGCRVVKLNRWTWEELVATEASLRSGERRPDGIAARAAE